MSSHEEGSSRGTGRTRRRGRPTRTSVNSKERGLQVGDTTTESNPEPSAGQAQEPAMTSALLEALQTLVRTSMTQAAPDSEGATLERKYLRDFMIWNPRTFNGSTNDPMVPEFWLSSIEKIFRQMNCPDVYKVGCATFMLEDDAQMWWESAERTLSVSGEPVLWEQFKEAFLSKYFPRVVRYLKQAEFLSLKQDNRTVAMYEREFTRLSRFGLGLISTEESKIYRFVTGLRDEIQGSMAAYFPTDYATAVQIAELIDSKTPRGVRVPSESESSSGQKRKFESFGLNIERKQRKDEKIIFSVEQKQQQQQGQQSGQRCDQLPCKNCGKYHWGQCLAPKVCFKCGKLGHIASQCQTKINSGGPSQTSTANQSFGNEPTPQQQGRVFAVTRNEAENSSNVVTGKQSFTKRLEGVNSSIMASELVVHNGGCHCKKVRWQVEAPASVVAWDCNCSDCFMRANTHFIVPSERFKLLGDSKNFISTYTYGTHTAKHTFCKACGITSFYHPRSNPDGVAITFKCVDPGTLRHVEIRQFDGRNWQASYDHTGIASFSKV